MSDATNFLAAGPLPRIAPDFHIVSPIGRIGDSLVYAARNGQQQARLREYAPPGAVRRGPDGLLRPIDPGLDAAWRAGITRFLAQADCLARIRHPGVAPVWEFGGSAQGDDAAAFLIGAPTGDSLETALARGLPLSPAGIVRIANELGAALAEIHARGLTHLDISPATLGIAAGHLQLSDFSVDNRAFMPLLQSQDGLVRPGYSPIELYDGARAEPLGPPADVYAASALLFTLIAGRAPPPWQERWRDPSASQLTERGAFPPALIEAIGRGLAIEPEDRYRDGTAWLAAMSGTASPYNGAPATITRAPPAAPLGQSVQPVSTASPALWTPHVQPVPAAPVPAQSPFVPHSAPVGAAAHGGAAAVPTPPFAPPPRRSNGLVPLLVLGLILLALAAGGFYAYQQGWFTPATEEPVGNKAAPRTERPAPRRQEAAIPSIEIGGTVSGQLTRRDQRRPSGQYQDSFSLAGRSGQRVELRLGSPDFDPLLSMTGPGFSAANDDDAGQGTTDSRLVVTLPRTGTYTITVSSYAAGQTGNYVLEVAAPRVETAIVTPAMLTGRWRRPSDMSCGDPATIRVDGPQLEYAFGDFSTVGRIQDGVGRTIRVEMEDGPEGGGQAAFVLAEDGASFTIDGETWLRC